MKLVFRTVLEVVVHPKASLAFPLSGQTWLCLRLGICARAEN